MKEGIRQLRAKMLLGKRNTAGYGLGHHSLTLCANPAEHGTVDGHTWMDYVCTQGAPAVAGLPAQSDDNPSTADEVDEAHGQQPSPPCSPPPCSGLPLMPVHSKPHTLAPAPALTRSPRWWWALLDWALCCITIHKTNPTGWLQTMLGRARDHPIAYV